MTTADRNRHKPTPSDNARSAHNDLPNRAIAEDEVILASELLLMELQNATDADLTISALMNSTNFCSISFGWSQHLTSFCAYLQTRAGFFEARNGKFDRFKEASGLIRAATGPR